ncbi:MAG: CDP-glycerol glycerophosphotransferase family protein [Rhabdochlamydiaceae bacterium]|nr:CDP-glycerol glycerophosphotransferase family protein [Rhabdochlamydiaceae bacterium]
MTESSTWSCAGLIYGPAPHYIDHLAPLCSILGIPLLVTEEEEESLLRTFYPDVKVHRIPSIEMPDFLVKHFDIVFVCTPRLLFDELFFFAQKLRNKRVHTIWCPHGNSDKGHRSVFMEGLNKEEISLVYGDKMIDFLKQKEVFHQLKKHIVTGNYRKSYYLKHKAFYDQILQEKVLRKLPSAEKLLFYAPTWRDAESSSSFFEATSILIETLPPNWNLIIKPHPNLLMENEEKNRNLMETYETKEQVLFLQDFPPISPLLAAMDLYIGDFSSIGYDALCWNKPMFFLNQQKRNPQTDQGLYLHQCGTGILPDQYESLYDIIRSTLPQDASRFGEIRKTIDMYTFGPKKNDQLIKQEVEASYACFPDKDLNFF